MSFYFQLKFQSDPTIQLGDISLKNFEAPQVLLFFSNCSSFHTRYSLSRDFQPRCLSYMLREPSTDLETGAWIAHDFSKRDARRTYLFSNILTIYRYLPQRFKDSEIRQNFNAISHQKSRSRLQLTNASCLTIVLNMKRYKTTLYWHYMQTVRQLGLT